MSKIKTYALGALVLVIAVPIYMGVKHKMAEPAGAACEKSTKCRGNSIFSSGMCLEDEAASYCTHECSSTDDCTTGMTCEAVEGTWTTETTRGNHATQTRSTQGTKNVCVKSPAK
jgi:hypothetical protein